MKNLALIHRLIYKYMVGTHDQLTLRIMSFIAIISISITTATLTLQLFIMAGFEEALNSKMQNIYPDVFITTQENESFNFNNMNTLFLKKYSEIKACAPGHTKTGLIKKDNDYYQHPVLIKAVDPTLESHVSNLNNKVKGGLALGVKDTGVIIGAKLYEKLHVTEGESITLLFHNETEDTTVEKGFTSVTLQVAGCIETGISYYDESLIICSLQTMKTVLADDTISTISFKLHNTTAQRDHFIKKIQQTYGYQTDCWQTLYPALVSASRLEKYVSTALLALMMLVASTTLTGFICMQIMRKKRDIALLKIIGISSLRIMYIFMSIGIIITSVAGCIGISLALIIGFILKKYQCIRLPDIYDIPHLPVIISYDSIIYVFIFIIVLGACASLLAVIHLKKSNSSHTLRFEE